MAKKKRVTKKQREERLRRLMWPWLWWLGMHQRYRVDWCWKDKLASGRWTKGQAEELPVAATACGQYPYRCLHLCLAAPVFDTLDDDDAEFMLLHELLHADVFWPLRRIVNQLTESDEDTHKVPSTKEEAKLTHRQWHSEIDRDEYATLEESAVDLLAHWLMRLKPEKGLPLLLKEHVRDKKV